MSKNKTIAVLEMPSDFEIRKKIRKTWQFKPIERVVVSKKVYNRKKFNIKDYED